MREKKSRGGLAKVSRVGWEYPSPYRLAGYGSRRQDRLRQRKRPAESGSLLKSLDAGFVGIAEEFEFGQVLPMFLLLISDEFADVWNQPLCWLNQHDFCAGDFCVGVSRFVRPYHPRCYAATASRLTLDKHASGQVTVPLATIQSADTWRDRWGVFVSVPLPLRAVKPLSFRDVQGDAGECPASTRTDKQDARTNLVRLIYSSGKLKLPWLLEVIERRYSPRLHSLHGLDPRLAV